MARQKQATPIRRRPSDFEDLKTTPETVNGSTKTPIALPKDQLVVPTSQAGMVQLVICVAGIYAAFLSWAFLQERITTTQYGSERFSYSVFLNTIQSTFAAFIGFIYLVATKPSGQPTPSIFLSSSIFLPLLLVAFTSSLASPFGYASLSHVDYITFILAKSCKLLPVMFLHLTIFRKSYPLYKYLIVASVTAGVAIFTICHPHSANKASSAHSQNSAWGLSLLAINLLFDGLTNSTQDHIFGKNRSYSGPQMMVAQNVLSTILTVSYLAFQPLIPSSLAFGTATAGGNELSAALDFISRHPAVLSDVLAFAACGAIGQIFIYVTLNKFSSLLLVTVTVTRKMLTMVLSVLWFGHKLTRMQWVGVGLVFGAIAVEAGIKRASMLAEKKKSKGSKAQ